MSLLFKSKDLRPVLVEAVTNQCRVILVKDRGVYFMSEKGERRPDGRWKRIAYAVGCNPDIDDDWWKLARAETGGDDFGAYCDPDDSCFMQIMQNECDLEVSVTTKHLIFKPVPKGH
jgi:hypothetical protein